MIQLHPGLAEELGREAHIFCTVDTPKPELLLMALQEVQRLFQLFHGAVKRRSEKENSEVPGVTGVKDLDSDAIFAGLISFHAAAVVIADGGCARRHLLGIHKVLRSWRWAAMAVTIPVSAGSRPAPGFEQAQSRN